MTIARRFVLSIALLAGATVGSVITAGGFLISGEKVDSGAPVPGPEIVRAEKEVPAAGLAFPRSARTKAVLELIGFDFIENSHSDGSKFLAGENTREKYSMDLTCSPDGNIQRAVFTFHWGTVGTRESFRRVFDEMVFICIKDDFDRDEVRKWFKLALSAEFWLRDAAEKIRGENMDLITYLENCRISTSTPDCRVVIGGRHNLGYMNLTFEPFDTKKE